MTMKIDEVRTLLDKYSKNQLRLIIAEMYKAIPKQVKEEKKIDSLLNAPEQFKKSGRPKTQKAPVPDIEIVGMEAEQFIEDAYNQYYFAPNSVIPKRQRPKWRFTARQLYKDLLAAAADENQLHRASDLLKQLYVLLCYSCSYILFSGDDPFRSVGINQTTFLKSVLTLRKRHLSQNDFSTEAVSLVVYNSLNYNTLTTDLINVAIEFFPTPDATESAIEVCDKFIKKGRKAPNRRRYSSTAEIKLEEAYNLENLATMAFFLCASLHEIERGIGYFKHKDIFPDEEIKTYIILNHLFSLQEKEHFIKEYKKAINQGVKPRDTLKTAYNTLQEKGEFPKYL